MIKNPVNVSYANILRWIFINIPKYNNKTAKELSHMAHDYFSQNNINVSYFHVNRLVSKGLAIWNHIQAKKNLNKFEKKELWRTEILEPVIETYDLPMKKNPGGKSLYHLSDEEIQKYKKEIENIIGKPVKYFTSGGMSDLFIFNERGKKYIFKGFRNIITDRCINFLKMLSDNNLIPKLYKITSTYSIMEYIDAITLKKLLKYKDKILYNQKEKIYYNIENKIKIWHDKGITHGDLKSLNILVLNNLDVVLIDPLCYFDGSTKHYDDKDLRTLKKVLLG